jgi:hypothetical protein
LWSSFFWHSWNHQAAGVRQGPWFSVYGDLWGNVSLRERQDVPGRRDSQNTVSTGSQTAACSDSTSHRSGSPPSAARRDKECHRLRSGPTEVAVPISELEGWGTPSRLLQPGVLLFYHKRGRGAPGPCQPSRNTDLGGPVAIGLCHVPLIKGPS